MSPTSIKVRFRIPHELDHFPPGLNYSVKYRSEFDGPNEWKSTELRHLPPRDEPCHGRGCETENGENYFGSKNQCRLTISNYSMKRRRKNPV